MNQINKVKKAEKNFLIFLLTFFSGIKKIFVSLKNVLSKITSQKITVMFIPHSEKKVFNFRINLFLVFLTPLIISIIFLLISIFAITYFNSAGGIWFSSNLVMTKDQITAEQNLENGKDNPDSEIKVITEGGGGGTESTNSKPGKKAAQINQVIENPAVKVYPNPFSDKLRFEFTAPDDTQARIELFDVTGRLIETVFDQPVQGAVKYNAEYAPKTVVSSMLFYRVSLGNEVFNGRVVYKK